MERSNSSLLVYAWLSIAAAVTTILLKSYAYWLTGSVGLLSDALESLINLAAAVIALLALTVSAKPPDKKHAYGHEKIEYFSSGAEGVMILLAALGILLTAWDRLQHPHPLQQLDIGLAASFLASLINLTVALILIRVGKRRHSIILEADGRHLMTDVWTTAGVIAGVGAIAVLERLGYQGWQILDPVIAMLVGVNIIWTGIGLMRRTVAGLMDVALNSKDQGTIKAVLDKFSHQQGVDYHALRTRYAGNRRFMSVHILVPGDWSVRQGHDLLESIEKEIGSHFDIIDIDTHLEPIEDIASWRHNNQFSEE